VTGEGGIIVDIEGNNENFFEWRLGRATNNQAKALALYQGMRIVDERNQIRLIVIRDLELVINSMSKTFGSNNSVLLRIFLQVKKEVEIFKSVEFFHVLRVHNQQLDSLTNKESIIECGIVRLIFFSNPIIIWC